MSLSATVTCILHVGTRTFVHKFYVADTYTLRAILRSDLLAQLHCTIDYATRSLHLPPDLVISLFSPDSSNSCLKVHIVEASEVPPHSTRLLRSRDLPSTMINSLAISFLP